MPLPGDPERELTTRVQREQILYLGWGAALLLHAADPHVAQAVADHSVFLNDPARRVERLYSTADTMLWLIFGTPNETRRAADRIRGIHDRVRGTLREDHPTCPAGTPYSAHDPALLAWVHVALHATLLNVYEAVVGPLEADERDRYCREAAAVEPLLGIPAGLLPRDAAALRAEFGARLAPLRRPPGRADRPRHPAPAAPVVGQPAPRVLAPLDRRLPARAGAGAVRPALGSEARGGLPPLGAPGPPAAAAPARAPAPHPARDPRARRRVADPDRGIRV